MYQLRIKVDFCDNCKQFTEVNRIDGLNICYTCRGAKPSYKTPTAIDEPYKPVHHKKLVTHVEKRTHKLVEIKELIKFIRSNSDVTAKMISEHFGVVPGHARLLTNSVKGIKKILRPKNQGYFYKHENDLSGDEKVLVFLTENYPMQYSTDEISSFVDMNKDYISKVCRRLSRNGLIITLKNRKGNRTLPHRYQANVIKKRQ